MGENKRNKKKEENKQNRMTARQTWKSAIDTPELYFPARGWERVTAYQLGDDGCDYGRWTGKRPTARPPTWKTDLEPRSFYVRAVKGGYESSRNATYELFSGIFGASSWCV